MNSKSKSAIPSSAARKRAAKPPGRGTRRAGTAPEAWEQTASVADERDDEVDCQRIIQGDGRNPPLFYDDYN
jgi:hypothetical protein